MDELERIIIKKENDEISVTRGVITPKQIGQEETHLCWDCTCGTPSKCSKVKDIRKKSIGEYPFITNGYQVFTQEGEMEKMIVTECNNYQLVEEIDRTPEEKLKIAEARKKLRLLYFGAQTLREANQIQEDLISRGQIITPKRGRY